MIDLLKIRHLTVVWEGDENKRDNGWLSLATNKAYVKNNLKTITINLRKETVGMKIW